MKTNMTLEAYREFIFDAQNILKCEKCPENQDMDDWQDRLPCGQWNCWVKLHCE